MGKELLTMIREGEDQDLHDAEGTVVIADPEPLFLVGAKLVCQEIGVRAVTARDDPALAAALGSGIASPSLVLANPRLWDADGLEHCGELREAAPLSAIGVVVERAHWWERERAKGLGVQAYLDKPRLTSAQFAPEVRALLAGRTVFPEPPERDWRSTLTRRELQVLQLLAQGMQVSTIARRLHLAERTVKATVAHAVTRLGAANRVEAVAIAFELGIIVHAQEGG